MATKQGKAPAKKAGATKKASAKDEFVLRDGKTKANPEAMAKALKVYGLVESEGGTPVEMLRSIRKYLDGVLPTLKEDDKIVCESACGEVSTSQTDFCPFCGDLGLEGEKPAAAPSKPKREETGKVEKPAKAEKVEKPAKAETGTAIAKAGAELDERVAKIQELQKDLAGNSYDLGLEILAITKAELWKARGHESFKQFVEKDLSIGRSLAYKLMDIVQQFDRGTFLAVGASKLGVIATMKSEDERTEALDRAKAGASQRDLKASRAGSTPARSGSGSAAAPPKKGANEITLLAKVGGKAVLHSWRSASTARPLSKHKDDAYVEVEISPDVRQRIALKMDAEGAILGLTVQFVRVADAAAE